MTSNKSKSNLILEEVILKHNDKCKTNDSLQTFLRENIDIIKIERLVEYTMAEVGGYDFIDSSHCDFSDGTECKTASVRQNPVKNTPACKSHTIEISNVSSAGGNLKSGALRVVLYNPILYKLKYYFIPNEDILNLGYNCHPTTGIGRLYATWNSSLDECRKLDKYEVETFEALAKTPAHTKFV
jgi:hypothetical protein